MKCPFCGYEIKGTSKFCGKCGKEIPKKYTKKTIPKLAVVIVIVLVLTAAALIFVMCRKGIFPEESKIEKNGGNVKTVISEKEVVDRSGNDREDQRDDEADDDRVEAGEHKKEIVKDDPDISVSDKDVGEGKSYDVENEIRQIQFWYNFPADTDEKFVLEQGEADWDYSREYYFHDKKLCFVFIYKGEEEHRLYFKDDTMIRYIDENKNIYDYENTKDFYDWEERALAESKRFYG